MSLCLQLQRLGSPVLGVPQVCVDIVLHEGPQALGNGGALRRHLPVPVVQALLPHDLEEVVVYLQGRTCGGQPSVWWAGLQLPRVRRGLDGSMPCLIRMPRASALVRARSDAEHNATSRSSHADVMADVRMPRRCQHFLRGARLTSLQS